MNISTHLTRLVCFSALSLSPCLHADAPAAHIEDVDWLAGNWQGQADGAPVDAHYSEPASGSILGYFRILENGAVSFFEFQRLVEEQGTLVLYPSPGGFPGVAFTLSNLTIDSAMFENPSNLYPRTITFSRDREGKVHIRAAGTTEGQPFAQEIVLNAHH